MSLTASPDKILSVAEFNTIVDRYLKEGIGQVTIRGEVSGFKVSQGKFAYFDIKDAASVLNCFAMAFRLDFPIEDGQEVAVTGTPGIHVKSGRYSLTVQSIQLHGEGSLQKAFEALKKKLELEGLFDASHKRVLPRFPERIGIITSGNGAAINDILKVVNGRWGGLTMSLVPVAVQGQNAPSELVSAVDYFNQHHPVDVIIFGRGGGSLEDLQAFNSERVAQAIFASRIPIISGVGHEHNTSICDLVADVRAATPSNAAEIAVPDRREIKRTVAFLQTQAHRVVEHKIHTASTGLKQAQHTLQLFISHKVATIRALIQSMYHAFMAKKASLPTALKDIEQAVQQLERFVRHAHTQAIQQLHEYKRVLTALNPTSILSRGYSITYNADTGSVISSVAQLAPNARIKTQLADGVFESSVGHSKPKQKVTKPPERPYETRQTTLI